ncbi:GEVED domain-containing protein [Subsaxibacter sp. CAU 1640]|uniref:GEVED domain-containing protein n=1 Tax=Subsaxibacter sp. CAU 1640 TaxID=2933271 RepID=UPI00200595C2|nr:GEVED domain-containing protein [Subsaxibacter sp. CAU 1640]MCK7589584.1 GEVED domain-containing protein [Subsaxibacter sp. CAU 1640]
MERFRIIEASVMDAELQARYPEIRSYAGQGVDDPTAVIRFSISPLGFQSMRLSANQPASFIEPITQDLTSYSVYKRADIRTAYNDFECKVTDVMNKNINGVAMRNADDGVLRRYRLAMSVTGEYTQYFGGTKALALSAINATMTRVNGVFENDFNVTMVLISNTDAVIYTSASSDPYSSNDSQWNSQLQSTLNSVIGNSNYDIGHLMGATGNNGNAGCIGCVCVTNQKGSGYTTSTVPTGDNFDIDFVAHEMGHQFGANHTWTFNGNEGTDVQMEPGSGSTIMGYAGITGATYDVQAHSDPYFHAISIEQVTDYVKTTSCQTNISTGNAAPTANAGSNYTIPKGTPFVLTGSGSDANSSDVLTYCWEQIDENNAVTKLPSTTATAGVAFRSYSPSTDTKRYFPNLATIKAGATSWKWEAVPNVARTLNFRLTVRDNKAGGASNKSDDTVITVNGTAGPFVVNSPNTNVTWNAGTTQTVTWSVAGTTGNGVNAANVDILLSTDGGNTYPITILANTPNDGSQAITVPNNPGSQNRIMVKGSNHIFFDISNTNFTIGGAVSCTATVPTGLSASNIGSSTATLNWNSVTGATYDLQYRIVGTSTWTTVAVTGTSTNLTGLTASTQYEAQVRSKCSGGSNSAYSSSVNFTTTAVQLNYCTSASTNTNDEYIGRVQLNTINNPSGAQFYSDFTSISTNLSKGTQYTITLTPTWTGTVYNEGYSVWIDYNRDGDFDDSGEQVWTRAATNTTPVSGSFTVPTGATTGATRMRVSMKYNAIPTACETFQYGEVEDYTVNIQGAAPDTTAPSTPTNLTASGTTQTTTNLSWTASTDNVAVTGYDVYQASTVIATVTGTTYQVTGLSPNTAYSFRVRAKDAAGNISGYSNTVNVTTLSNSVTYCTSQGNNTNDEYIDRVQLGSINNLSGNNGGYGNFTNLSTTLIKGTSNSITITPRWTGTVYNEAYRVWIDYNQDGDFNDSGEQVYNRTRTTATPISGSFTVPTSALNGATRMRVSMKYNASPTSCETFTYGEVEDYTVVISSSAREEVEGVILASTEFSVYPNPVKGSQLNLKVQGIEPNQVTIFNALGQVVAKQVFSNALDVSNLQGGIYVIEISDDNQKLTKRFIKQ